MLILWFQLPVLAGGGIATASPGVPPCVIPSGLSKAQVERYSRHMLLPSFGAAAQAAVCRAAVLIIGCGGLGSPCSMYLAAAGVGEPAHPDPLEQQT
jgi:hypothetical protein